MYFHGPLFRKDSGTHSEYYVIDSRLVSIVTDSLLKKYENDRVNLYADLAALPCAGFTAH